MGSRSLFPSLPPGLPPGSYQVAPGGSQVVPVGQTATVAQATPVPGPNAFEVVVGAYDPDSQVLVVRIKDSAEAEEVEAIVDLQAMTANGTIEIVLGPNKLSPKIEIKISPRVKPPKFASPEEADAWLEANA